MSEPRWERDLREVVRIVERASRFGHETQADGARFFGRLPQAAPLAWLHRLYPPCPEAELVAAERALELRLADEHRWLLRRCNGMDLFDEALALFGAPRGRPGHTEAFDLVSGRWERLDVPDSWVYAGTFAYDGGQVYCDTASGAAYLCVEGREAPVHRWPSLLGMLRAEAMRLESEFDEVGRPRGESSGRSLASRPTPAERAAEPHDDGLWRTPAAAERFRRWRGERPDEVGLGAGGVVLFDAAARIRWTQAGRAAGWDERWVAVGMDSALGDPIVLAGDPLAAVYVISPGPDGETVTQIADSLEGFGAALDALRAAARGRENPVELEANPLSEADRAALEAAVREANPGAETWWWR